MGGDLGNRVFTWMLGQLERGELFSLMPLELASKLFLVMVFGLIAGGTIWLNRVASGAWRFWPLLRIGLPELSKR